MSQRLALLALHSPFPLESRLLCTVAAVTTFRPPGTPGSVRNLGVVSADAAEAGVSATAWISPDEPVIFRFTLAVGGDYVLFFRHSGEKVSLTADTPGGTAVLTPGPPGPFKEFLLPLPAGEYAVTAASGDGPAFVDWDLLLANGVGEAVAQASSLVTEEPTAIAPTSWTNATPAGSGIPSANAPAYPSSPTGLATTPGGTLVGRPAESLHVTAVPADDQGLMTLAQLGPGLGPQLAGVPQPRLPSDGAMVAPEFVKKDKPPDPNREAVASADRIEQVLALVKRIVSVTEPGGAREAPVETTAIATEIPALGREVTAPSEGKKIGSWLPAPQIACLVPLTLFVIRYGGSLPRPFHRRGRAVSRVISTNPTPDPVSDPPGLARLPGWRRNSMILRGSVRLANTMSWRRPSMPARTGRE